MTHVRTSPYYPQSNGKIERWHKSLKGECIRPGTPLSLEDARRLVQGYVEHYNNVRLNSAVGYITPKDMLAGRQQEIHAERDRKLEGGPKTAPGSSSEGRVKNEEPRSQSRMKCITSGLRPPGHNPNNQLQMSPVPAVGRFQTKSANPSRTWLSGYGRGRPPHLPLSWA
jgi:Integrase core domain